MQNEEKIEQIYIEQAEKLARGAEILPVGVMALAKKLQESKKELYDQIIKSGDEAISKLNFEDIKFLLG